MTTERRRTVLGDLPFPVLLPVVLLVLVVLLAACGKKEEVEPSSYTGQVAADDGSVPGAVVDVDSKADRLAQTSGPCREAISAILAAAARPYAQLDLVAQQQVLGPIHQVDAQCPPETKQAVNDLILAQWFTGRPLLYAPAAAPAPAAPTPVADGS